MIIYLQKNATLTLKVHDYIAINMLACSFNHVSIRRCRAVAHFVYLAFTGRRIRPIAFVRFKIVVGETSLLLLRVEVQCTI